MIFRRESVASFLTKMPSCVCQSILEPDIADFMRKIAGQKNTDIEKLVNDWLRRNIELIETIEH